MVERRACHSAALRFSDSKDPYELNYQYEKMMEKITDRLRREARQAQELRNQINASISILKATAVSASTDDAKRPYLELLVSKLSGQKSQGLEKLSATALSKLDLFLAQIVAKCCMDYVGQRRRPDSPIPLASHRLYIKVR
jgi:hypothetical protein